MGEEDFRTRYEEELGFRWVWRGLFKFMVMVRVGVMVMVVVTVTVRI